MMGKYTYCNSNFLMTDQVTKTLSRERLTKLSQMKVSSNRNTKSKRVYRYSSFWDRMANSYSKKAVPDQEVYEKKLELIQGHLNPDSSVLEVGCGSGSTALALAPLTKSIVATDFSAKMIDIAQNKAKQADVKNVSFVQKSIEDFNQASGHYDVILALSVLHLVEDRVATLKRLFDELKPGGVLISSTVCMGDGLSFFKFIGPIGRALRILPMLAVFKEQELLETFKTTGFEIESKWHPNDQGTVFLVARKPR